MCVLVCVGVCGVWSGHSIHILRRTPKVACFIHIVLREKVQTVHMRIKTRHYLYSYTSKTCLKMYTKVRDPHTLLPGPSGRPRRASQCGMAWAEVPARCQGFVCHARSTPAVARTRHTTRPEGNGTHAPTYTFHPSVHPSPTTSFPYVFTSFSLPPYFSV